MKLITTKQATLAQAKRITADLRRDYEELKTGWFDLGKKVDRALKAGVPHALALNVNDWITQWASDEEQGRSTILDSVRIVRALSKLPESTVRALPRSNAIDLTRLPESERSDRNGEWVRKAKNMPTREFKEAVKAARGEKPQPKDDKQEFRCLKVDALPIETYEQIIDFRDRIAKVFGCGEDKPKAPWILLAAFLAMVEEVELIAFMEGVSQKVKAS